MFFKLKTIFDTLYNTAPENNKKPVIGLTANFSDGNACLAEHYYSQVLRYGGIPVIIPPIYTKDTINETLDRIDGLILTGGGDINPLYCGEEPSENLHAINGHRDLAELIITRMAYNRQMPILGICRGIQMLVAALDGEVAQDIKEDRERKRKEYLANNNDSYYDSETGFHDGATDETPYYLSRPLIKHSQDAERNIPTHSVRIKEGTILKSLYKTDRIYVNSFHHQAVRATGKHFRISAVALDGVIEAIESIESKPVIGVQWHPECMEKEGRPLFKWLVDRSWEYNRARHLHKRILTIDTHCDTPMFFPQDVRFDCRDSRIKVDLHKMTEGMLDAVFMVAYLPQPKPGETFTDNVEFNVSGPKEYADLIFDKIETIVQKHPDNLGIAMTEAGLLDNKLSGRKSVVLGIENGLALEGDIANIEHFARRGVRYITLCHNGDNEICDSARGTRTHGGVSTFGAEVIREMNRQGIMVDMSHASETSFYDALDISRKPIVCSHSNCRALCDVPRNLTDDQLRALAAKGGVAHTTLYHGFLRTEGRVSVIDAINHLEHAIDIMGIDHVGIGTDFDGDGGVPGFNDASEAINFTMHLLRRKYSESDIRKIWGGNWLRVMNAQK